MCHSGGARTVCITASQSASQRDTLAHLIPTACRNVCSRSVSTLIMHFEQNLGNAKFEMLLILAFNKAFIKDMESKDLFMVDNLIASLKSTTDATEAVTNIIKYFDLDSDVEDDETDEGMEIVTMLKSTAYDIQQQHDANGSAIAQKRVRNE